MWERRRRVIPPGMPVGMAGLARAAGAARAAGGVGAAGHTGWVYCERGGDSGEAPARRTASLSRLGAGPPAFHRGSGRRVVDAGWPAGTFLAEVRVRESERNNVLAEGAVFL